jgi:cold shock CspA family protein
MPVATQKSQRQNGTIREWNRASGFGIVVAESDSNVYFLHASQVSADTRDMLSVGAFLEFTPLQDGLRWRAVRASVIK